MRHAVPDEVDGDKDQFEGLELKNWENQQNHELVLPTNYISWMKLIAISILDFPPSGVSSIFYLGPRLCTFEFGHFI